MGPPLYGAECTGLAVGGRDLCDILKSLLCPSVCTICWQIGLKSLRFWALAARRRAQYIQFSSILEYVVPRSNFPRRCVVPITSCGRPCAYDAPRLPHPSSDLNRHHFIYRNDFSDVNNSLLWGCGRGDMHVLWELHFSLKKFDIKT